MENRKLKIILFILLIILLSVLMFYSIFGFSYSHESINSITQTRKEKKLIDNLTINEIKTVYDKENNIFYYPETGKKEKENIILKLDLKKGYKYKLINNSSRIIKLNFNKTYPIIIYNDKHYFKTNIRFSNLPIISISEINTNDITNEDSNAQLDYINPSALETQVSSKIKIHIRGGTARWYDKKSYKINTYNHDYSDKNKINLSNFSSSDSFILDATFRDTSKIRNVLAFDIWNLVSDDFTNVDIKTEFVEVFINGEYRGIYTLIESIKRSTLKLNKSTDIDTSVIIKGFDYTHNIYHSNIKGITSDSYVNFELKYPNDKKLYPKAWEKSLSILSDYYNPNMNVTDKIIKNTFNFDNYVDILLFNTFLNNNDNAISKNNYFYMKSLNDNKMYIEPWDMEFSMGLHWCSKCEYNVEKLNDVESIDAKIDTKGKEETARALIKRYKTLRKDVLTEKNFDTFIDKYKQQLKYAGERDSKLWIKCNIEKEIEDVRTWLKDRLVVFDKYVEELENEL